MRVWSSACSCGIALGIAVSMSGLAGELPSIRTLSAQDLEATSATLVAQVSVGDYGWVWVQILANPDFELPGEESSPPSYWAGPVFLEGEEDPTVVEFLQRAGYQEPSGDYAAYLKYATESQAGWVGVAYGQTLTGVEVRDYAIPLTLSYWLRPQYAYGTGVVSAWGGLVEVELVVAGDLRLVRYLHLWKGDPPPDSESVRYVNGLKPSWQLWSRFEHDLTSELEDMFPQVEYFSISALRLGVLIHKQEAGLCRIYWLFDRVELCKGEPGVYVYFEYRRQGDSDWVTTSPIPVSESGQYQVTVTGLAPETPYEFRAVLEYSEGILYGEVLTLTTPRYPGDVDGDSRITILDVRLAFQAAKGLMELDHAQMLAADVNRNGRVDLEDVARIAGSLIGSPLDGTEDP